MNRRTLRMLNKKLLQMQCLSNKIRGSESVIKVSEACCGINSQDFKESLSSYWTRIENIKDKDFFSELKPKKGLVRTWTVRSTMHTIPSKDYYMYIFGSGRNKILSRYDRYARQLGIPRREVRVESLYQPLLDNIKGEAVTSNYIKQFMIDRLDGLGLASRAELRRGWTSQPTFGPSWIGITEMSYLGFLVSAGREGSESLWMNTSDYLNLGRSMPDPEDCTIKLVSEYIQRYGPVTRSDIAYWNNGLFSKEVDNCLRVLEKDLTQEHFQGSKETYYSYGRNSEETVEPPKVIILPEFDSIVMGYKDKSRFLSKENLKNVSRPQGNIRRTILLDGFISATWVKKRF